MHNFALWGGNMCTSKKQDWLVIYISRPKSISCHVRVCTSSCLLFFTFKYRVLFSMKYQFPKLLVPSAASFAHTCHISFYRCPISMSALYLISKIWTWQVIYLYILSVKYACWILSTCLNCHSINMYNGLGWHSNLKTESGSLHILLYIY